MSLHFRWPKRDKTKCYNVISSRFVAFPVSHSWSHFRGWHQGCQVFATKPAQLLLKTSPKLAQSFRGGFPVKVRIPGAKYHVIGVTSTHGHEKQQFRRRQQTKLSLTPRKGPMAGFIWLQFTSNTSNRHTFYLHLLVCYCSSSIQAPCFSLLNLNV